MDPESITFLTAKKSPTGNAGILFSGSWSGTLSLYEFEGCQTVTGGEDDDHAKRGEYEAEPRPPDGRGARGASDALLQVRGKLRHVIHARLATAHLVTCCE